MAFTSFTQTDAIAAKIAYACIYSENGEFAAAHLVSLVRDRACGLAEGPDAWQHAINEILQSDRHLKKLNQFGAHFDVTQWRNILEEVFAQLQPKEGMLG